MKETFASRPAAISLSSIIAASSAQVSSAIEQEAVILHLKSGIYYGLNPLGARIWDLVQEPRAVAQIRDVLLAEYAVTEEQCQSDLLKLLDEMRAASLIEVRDARAD